MSTINTTIKTDLTREEAQQMAEAIHTINRLENSGNPRSNEEEIQLKGLKLFLSNTFLAHAPEFVGAWLAINFEYEPLVHSVAALLRRADGINAMKQQQQIAAKQSNIIQPELKVVK